MRAIIVITCSRLLTFSSAASRVWLQNIHDAPYTGQKSVSPHVPGVDLQAYAHQFFSKLQTHRVLYNMSSVVNIDPSLVDGVEEGKKKTSNSNYISRGQ